MLNFFNFPIVMTHLCSVGPYNYSCKFVIGLFIYIKSRKVHRVLSLSHQRFSDDRGGELYFSTTQRHYFCLSVCLLIILSTVALIFSTVNSHGSTHNKDSLIRGLLIFGVFCGRNFSRPIFLKFYFSYLSINISYKS